MEEFVALSFTFSLCITLHLRLVRSDQIGTVSKDFQHLPAQQDSQNLLKSSGAPSDAIKQDV